MILAAELRAAVLQVIEERGPVLFAVIAKDESVNEVAIDKKQITNMVYNLKKFGHIRKDKSGRYYLPEGDEMPAQIETPAPVVETRDHPKDFEDAERIAARTKVISELMEIKEETQALGITDEEEAEEEPEMWIADWRVRELLEEQHRVAQDALDKYLTSVGDPKIIECLRAPRDAARGALELLDGGDL